MEKVFKIEDVVYSETDRLLREENEKKYFEDQKRRKIVLHKLRLKGKTKRRKFLIEYKKLCKTYGFVLLPLDADYGLGDDGYGLGIEEYKKGDKFVYEKQYYMSIDIKFK